MQRFVVLLLAAWTSFAWTGHMHRSRTSDRGDLLFAAPLLSDVGGGTFTRASSTSCDATGTSYTTLSSGAVCQSATYGPRLGSGSVNYAANSKTLNSWTAVGATVGADAVTGPGGSVDAERIQFTGANQRVTLAQAGLTPGQDVVFSVWLQTHAGGAACTVDVGSTTALGGKYLGGLVSVGMSWTRHRVQSVASPAGVATLSISNLATLGHGTPDCADIDAADAQIEDAQEGPGAYCSTGAGAGPATCNAETITWPWLKRIDARKSTGQFVFRATERASWDQRSDKVFLNIPVDGGGSWQIGWDESASMLTFSAGGQTAKAPASWAPRTTHTITWAAQDGRPVAIRWDEDYPQYSSGNYSTPTFTAAGVITLGGQIDGFYSGLKIWRSYKLGAPTVSHYAPLVSALTTSVGAGAYAYTGPVWTCMSSGGGSLATKALNSPCYLSSAEDATGSAGDGIGVRVERATTNRISTIEAAGAGSTPTGWSTSGAGAPLTVADPFWGTYSAVYTANGASRYIYETDADTGPNAFSYYAKYGAGTAGELLAMTYGAGTITTIPIVGSARGWHREGQRMAVALGSAVYIGNAVGFGTQPSGQDITVDAAQYTYDVSYHQPYCDGAPPATCTAETLSAVYGVDINAVAGTLRVYVTPAWGAAWTGRHWGNASGLDAKIVWNSADWQLYWDDSEYKWTFVAGGQTVTSAAQSFPPLSTHEIIVIWLDGAPLLLQVNGQAVVSSAGNKAAAALAATTYLGTDSGGGSEFGGWIGHVEVR